MVWRKCHGCGAMGSGRSLMYNCFSGISGISMGVGLPMISVSSAMVLLRMPPFHQPS